MKKQLQGGYEAPVQEERQKFGWKFSKHVVNIQEGRWKKYYNWSWHLKSKKQVYNWKNSDLCHIRYICILHIYTNKDILHQCETSYSLEVIILISISNTCFKKSIIHYQTNVTLCFSPWTWSHHTNGHQSARFSCGKHWKINHKRQENLSKARTLHYPLQQSSFMSGGTKCSSFNQRLNEINPFFRYPES